MILCTVVAAYMIYGLSGCAVSPRHGVIGIAALSMERPSLQKAHRIWVVKTSWHTGLALSSADAGSKLIALLAPIPLGRDYVFGWGERRYYMSPHPTSGVSLAALFPSRSVVLVQSCRRRLVMCLGTAVHLRAVWVSDPDLFRLRRYLANSLLKNKKHQTVPVAQGPYSDSEFFASPLSYDAFYTCNTWTARALETAGLPVSDAGVIFAYQVWSQLPTSKRWIQLRSATSLTGRVGKLR